MVAESLTNFNTEYKNDKIHNAKPLGSLIFKWAKG